MEWMNCNSHETQVIQTENKKKWLKHNSIYAHYNYADLNGL